jgi:UDPglucose--hexose-1-phosphate uridylyltransferase
MPELRLNIISREWVVIAYGQGKSPEAFVQTKVIKRQPDFLDTCPFCTGNEAKSDQEQYRIHDGQGWKVRSVLNKFSKLSVEGERKRWNTDLKKNVNGVGIHEMIVESPVHSHSTATMPVEQLREVIRAYRERFVAIYSDPRVEHVIVFKNFGVTAGTAIEHSLSQIVGIPITPLAVRNRVEGAMRFYDETGECLICRTIQDELADGARVLVNTEHFMSCIPYAALSPFHTWIFPKRHSGSISGLTQEEMADFALNLRTTMAKISYGLGQPDYNYVIRSGNPAHERSEFIHWYMSIVPRVATASGFELGSGIYINPVAPEKSAEFLRNVKIPS